MDFDLLLFVGGQDVVRKEMAFCYSLEAFSVTRMVWDGCLCFGENMREILLTGKEDNNPVVHSPAKITQQLVDGLGVDFLTGPILALER